MDIIELAIASGMHITLDGRIGTQEYSSVHGSVQALRRFAEAVVVAVPLVARQQVDFGMKEKEGEDRFDRNRN
ncbi:hypothetical protein A6V36_21235 [Paraburkholderia ginsengiterrae]|uniref:Uncharacterized protein n=1 Tax=Paraburkholderia ginsengiterrae TaxID=1462993 RepID=A0A1A9NA39_9BURK|nr:hypothetical protein [Paraburkholderia ginsengiterrae]OAJ62473.1 hypothetical protein A6V36_21235 [Paraburkholderia ginsengiterrae]OAJ62600.1 hypothetical protein A6V37_22525 [Paraburkholderia ginsengiterrae]